MIKKLKDLNMTSEDHFYCLAFTIFLSACLYFAIWGIVAFIIAEPIIAVITIISIYVFVRWLYPFVAKFMMEV